MRVIGILSGKGGVGKTTIAINLACALGLLKKRVGLIDFNFTTSHLAIELGMIPQTTLNSVLRNEDSIDKAIYPCFNIYIIPASLNLSDLKDIELSKIKLKIEELSSNFDITLLDSAPGFGREALAAIQASNETIFVTDPTLAAIADVIKCKQLVTQLGATPLGIVVNKCKRKKFEIEPREIADLTGLPLLATIREDEDFLKSEAERVPMIFYKRHKAEEFLRLGCMLTGNEYKKSSFLERILSRLFVKNK